MNSSVTLRDLKSRELETYTLVFPEDADIAHGRLSVLAPVGTAILGQRVGDELKWRVPEGWRKFKIERVLYQPEREGVFDSDSDKASQMARHWASLSESVKAASEAAALELG